MRARYLAAVLRQDVEYFDLKVGSTADVIASVCRNAKCVPWLTHCARLRKANSLRDQANTSFDKPTAVK